MTAPTLRIAESGSLRYVLSVPPDADRNGAPPLLCFLHGYDEAAPLPLEQGVTRHGPLRRSSSPFARARFLIVAPQLPRAGDLWLRYGDGVRAVVDEVQREHGADPRRMYLTGFSFGGNGVFDLAQADDRWTALWVVDPTRVPRTDPRRPIWLSVGAASRHLTSRFVSALGLEPSNEKGAAQGDRVIHDEGQDHVGSATLAYRDDRIYEWLMERAPAERSGSAPA